MSGRSAPDVALVVMPGREHRGTMHDNDDEACACPIDTPQPPSTLTSRRTGASTAADCASPSNDSDCPADAEDDRSDIDAMVDLTFDEDAAEFLRAVDEADSPDGTGASGGRMGSTVAHRRAVRAAEEKLNLVDGMSDSATAGASSSAAASSTAAASASSASSSSTGRSSGLTLATAWAALLIAVFSMSAVGPMFLYMQKRGIAPLRAVFWRQTVQIFFLIPPAILEFRRTPIAERYWWRKRVQLGSDEQQPQQQQDQQQSQQLSQQVPVQSQKKKKGAYETVANDAASPSAVSSTRIDVAPASADAATAADLSSPPVASSIDEDAVASLDAAPPKQPLQGRSPLLSLLLISTYWGTSVSLWVVALPFTSAARASLFSSLYPLFIIVFMRVFRKVPVSLGEFVGVFVCIVGIVVSEVMASLAPDENTMAAKAARAAHEAAAAETALSTFNATVGGNSTALIPSSSAVSAPDVAHLQLVGDLLCILSSIFIGLDVIESSPARKVVPLFSFTVLTSMMTWLMLLVATVALEGSTFSSEAVAGLWGWTDSTEMALRLLAFGFLVGMVGILGFNNSVSHISPIVFSTVQLLDPGISGVMSALFGVEGWPTPSTYLGVAVVTAGIFLVVFYQTKRETEAEKAKAKKADNAAATVASSSFPDESHAATGGGDLSPDAGVSASPELVAGSTRQRRDRAPSAYERVEMQEMNDVDDQTDFEFSAE